MKIVRYKEVPVDRRSDGRSVRKLASVELGKLEKTNAALYFCEVPESRFEGHYHSDSTEVIMFPEGGDITVNGEDYAMDKWDFVILEPGD